jgi:hypothetical protein
MRLCHLISRHCPASFESPPLARTRWCNYSESAYGLIVHADFGEVSEPRSSAAHGAVRASSSRLDGRVLVCQFQAGIDATTMPMTSFHLTALVSSALVVASTSAMTQNAASRDAAGIEVLVARSASHAVYIERTSSPRPNANSSPDGDEGMAGEPVNPAVAHALGCLIAGSVGTGVAALAGTGNVVQIIAGGHVAPASQLALYTAVVGVIFGTFCAVGQALTPLYLYVARSSAPPASNGRLEHKIQWRIVDQPRPDRNKTSSAGLSPEEDMSLPASWLPHRF